MFNFKLPVLKKKPDTLTFNDLYGKIDVLSDEESSTNKVYRVRNKQTTEMYAAKEIMIDSTMKSQLDEEISIMSKVKHENLIKFYECVKEKNICYIVMECCECDLACYLKENNISGIQELLDWSKQLISGVKYLHDINVIHRDIKPSNIFLKRISNKKILKLGDFGISRELKGTNHTSSRFGTELYMAPERFRDKKYDNKCDIWALGITIYEMITHHKPFKTIDEILSNNQIPPLNVEYSITNHFIQQ